MVKALFRKKLNTAIKDYRTVSKQLMELHRSSNSGITRRKQELVLNGSVDGKQISTDRLTTRGKLFNIIEQMHSPNKNQVIHLHDAKRQAIEEIDKQTKSRKSFLKGTIRLLRAKSKTRERLSRMSSSSRK